jgi:hypothetical protein
VGCKNLPAPKSMKKTFNNTSEVRNLLHPLFHLYYCLLLKIIARCRDAKVSRLREKDGKERTCQESVCRYLCKLAADFN